MIGAVRSACRRALVVALAATVLLPAAASGGGVAFWQTRVAKTGDCEVTVTVPIEIHGAAASQAVADQWKAEMEHRWNGPTVELITRLAKKHGLDPNNLDDFARLDELGRRTLTAGGVPANATRVDCCTIKFVFDVRVRGASARPGYHQIEAVPEFETKQIRGKPAKVRVRDHVMGGGASHHFSATGKWAAAPGRRSAAAHEVGHLMGLDDQYEDRHIISKRTGQPVVDPATGKPLVWGSRSKPGHELDIMSNRSPRGWPMEDAIRTIIRYGGVRCNCCPQTTRYDDPTWLMERVESHAAHLETALRNDESSVIRLVISGLERYDEMVGERNLSWFDRSYLKERIADLLRRARAARAGNAPADRANAPVALDLLDFDPTWINPPGSAGPRDPVVQLMVLLAPRQSSGAGITVTGAGRQPPPPSPGQLSAWWQPPGIPGVQAGAGLPAPPDMSLYLTSLGASSGEAFTGSFVNRGPSDVTVLFDGLIIEPLQGSAQATAGDEQAAVPSSAQSLTLEAFCLEPLADPPPAGRMFRVAEQALQDRFAPMREVLRAAERARRAGLLHPDSDPAGYFDSIRQWALWSRVRGLDLSSFTDDLIEHTRRNAEAAGFQWSESAADLIRAAAPGRWADIQEVFAQMR